VQGRRVAHRVAVAVVIEVDKDIAALRGPLAHPLAPPAQICLGDGVDKLFFPCYTHFDVNVKVSEQMKNKLRIGEFAELAGVTPRTIRYYEGLGLLGPSEREGQGFRYYSEVELLRLKKIDYLKQLGLSLEEISEVLPLYYDDPTGLRGKRRILEMLQTHLHETDEKIAGLQQFRDELRANILRTEQYIAEMEAKE
jgi:MerR family copper efflux transcriptional regulator